MLLETPKMDWPKTRLRLGGRSAAPGTIFLLRAATVDAHHRGESDQSSVGNIWMWCKDGAWKWKAIGREGEGDRTGRPAGRPRRMIGDACSIDEQAAGREGRALARPSDQSGGSGGRLLGSSSAISARISRLALDRRVRDFRVERRSFTRARPGRMIAAAMLPEYQESVAACGLAAAARGVGAHSAGKSRYPAAIGESRTVAGRAAVQTAADGTGANDDRVVRRRHRAGGTRRRSG